MSDHFKPGCTQYPAAWFSEEHEHGFVSRYPAGVHIIRKICDACPMKDACLQAAMDFEGSANRSSRFGMWGGLTPGQRARLHVTLTREKVAV